LPYLRHYSLSDILPDLPPPIPLGAEAKLSGLHYDLGFFTLGFEERCTSVAQQFARHGTKIDRACILEYGPVHRLENEVNREELTTYLARVSKDIVSLEVDVERFEPEMRRLIDGISTELNDRSPTVLVDISVASNRLILNVLSIVLEAQGDLDLTIVYSEANQYAPTKEEYQEDPKRWAEEGLVHGVGDIKVGVAYAGNQRDPLPDLLVIIPGFGRDRARAIISEVLPGVPLGPSDQIVWLVGKPHLEQDQWRLQALVDIHELNGVPQLYELDTFDYGETLSTLEAIYQRHSQSSQITIAPGGSKMQAVGASLFCMLRPDVRLIFASAERYASERYSKGCKAIWEVQIGKLEMLRKLCRRVDTIKVVSDSDAPT
jgi:hypothetical protein